MSLYLGSVLNQYCDYQSEYKMERPIYDGRTLLGYMLMNFGNRRMLLVGSVVKESSKMEVLLPLDMMKLGQNMKVNIVIGAGERLFITHADKLRWDPPFAIKGILVAKVNLSEIGAEQLGSPVAEPLPSEHAGAGNE